MTKNVMGENTTTVPLTMNDTDLGNLILDYAKIKQENKDLKTIIFIVLGFWVLVGAFITMVRGA